VGPRAGLDRCGKSRPLRNSIPGPSSPKPVTIPTELPDPHVIKYCSFKAFVPYNSDISISVYLLCIVNRNLVCTFIGLLEDPVCVELIVVCSGLHNGTEGTGFHKGENLGQLTSL